MDFFNNNQDRNDHVPQPPVRRTLLSDIIGQLVIRGFVLIIICILVFLAGYLCWILINSIGDQSENGFRYIIRLFRDAKYMFENAHGFGAFVKLMLIAACIGWVINKFRKRQ